MSRSEIRPCSCRRCLASADPRRCQSVSSLWLETLDVRLARARPLRCLANRMSAADSRSRGAAPLPAASGLFVRRQTCRSINTLGWGPLATKLSPSWLQVMCMDTCGCSMPRPGPSRLTSAGLSTSSCRLVTSVCFQTRRGWTALHVGMLKLYLRNWASCATSLDAAARRTPSFANRSLRWC